MINKLDCKFAQKLKQIMLSASSNVCYTNFYLYLHYTCKANRFQEAEKLATNLTKLTDFK